MILQPYICYQGMSLDEVISHFEVETMEEIEKLFSRCYFFRIHTDYTDVEGTLVICDDNCIDDAFESLCEYHNLDDTSYYNECYQEELEAAEGNVEVAMERANEFFWGYNGGEKMINTSDWIIKEVTRKVALKELECIGG